MMLTGGGRRIYPLIMDGRTRGSYLIGEYSRYIAGVAIAMYIAEKRVPDFSSENMAVRFTLVCEEGFRVIEHVAGEDCIPAHVTRVAVFDTGATELLLALNYAPVVRSAFLEQFQLAVLPELESDLTALTGSLPDMGFPINQEVLLAAAPEVIITNSDFAALFPENTETIAPLILLGRE